MRQRSTAPLWIILCFVLVVGLAIAGFGIFEHIHTSPRQLILGAWESQRGMLEFFNDGTVAFTAKGETVATAGTYSFPSDIRIKIESKVLGSEVANIVDVYVSANELTLAGNRWTRK